MYRFLLRPKWIVFHLLVLAGIASMLTAANWQWNRYIARNDFVAAVEARQDTARTPPTELTALLDGVHDRPLGTIEYRIATANGHFLPTAQLIQILRVQDGVQGVNLLWAFQIDDGPIVLVNRGFVPEGVDVGEPTLGQLRIGGTVRVSQQRRLGELTDSSAGVADEVRRIDLTEISERLHLDLAPVYLDFINSDPAPLGELPTPVPAPDVSGGPPHLSYTVQWLLFTAAVVVGWILAVRHSVRQRRRDAARAAAVPGTTADTAAADELSEAAPTPPSA
ncbi:MAG TPA: SURF1 family protein [Ilumatobacteraceae bacterium]|nr:SURF1 family protein [Ilumatobacteraceae bacterium]